MYRACPVCGSQQTMPTVTRAAIPLLQNRVYLTEDEARDARCASFTLCTCAQCSFSFNGEFDDSLIVYDENYNNDVPSPTFERYSEDVARDLIQKFDLTTGTVYDIGCGNGTFLRMLCRLAPGIQGIGIDPSCDPTEEGNFRLVRDVFRPGSFGKDTKLVVLRHVLEHITEPVKFLQQLGEAAPGVPLYVEVPDVTWIFQNGAFWDFCYEHCNYFSPSSLKNALSLAGFSHIEQRSAFGGQYQWAIGVPGGSDFAVEISADARAIADAKAYHDDEASRIANVRGIFSKGGKVAVWGMATKGVMLTCLVDDPSVAVGIDINQLKQGKYTPVSAVRINPPQHLLSESVGTVLIMNGNYGAEIKAQLVSMGITAEVVSM